MRTPDRTRPALLPLLVLAAGAFLSCGPRVADGPWNVLFVLVDTLRADRLSLYGHHRATSPNLDRFAGDAVVFTTVQAQAGCTFPSVNSLLTSRYPAPFIERAAQAGGGKREMGIPEGMPTLAGILADRGYRTAAVSASPVVRATPSRVNPVGGFGAGFEVFDEECVKRQNAACVNGRALELLDGLDEPFLLYLHFMDPHAPYRPPADHARRFPDAAFSHRFIGAGNPLPVVRGLKGEGPPVRLTAADVDQLGILYDEEVSYFDEQLARLLEALEARGLLERTVVVLVSDHGEELLEHGEIGHCWSLTYDTVLGTPLALRIPGVPGGVREARVQNLDVLPTLLDYLGVAADDLGLQGRSLRPAIEEEREVNRYLFALQGRSRAISDGRWKLILDVETGAARLFDLAADPGETEDLAAAHPEEAGRLLEVLRRWVELEGGGAGSLRAAEEVEKHLRAVGYL
ncbi:MAG TPA: sulfatase [Thermoanaerobaculia bacterium]|nr:sulfatase [Thermoanaerobaculia bacterium]